MSDDQTENTPPLLKMGDLIRYFESQSRLLDKHDHMIPGPTLSDHDYISNIKFNGVPILPPVMTTKRRDEMMSYKRQAQFREKRLKSRQRSRLMARAQNIVNDTQTDLSDLDTLSSNFSHPAGSTLKDEDDTHQTTLVSHISTLHSTGLEQTSLQTLTNTAMTYATMDQQLGLDEPGLQTLDSLSSDLASLEDLSLPTDFSGMPLTSVKQQQISQTLARLSKALNMKESLNSTGSSEVSEAGQVALKLSLGSPQPTAARFYNPDNYSQNHSETSSVFHDSQDTIVEVSQDLTANSTSGFVSNANSELHTDGSGHSPNDSASIANTSHSSANCSASTVDSQKSNKSSPKSLKNTVHFANFVTEITRQSVEDNITLRKLEDTPTNSPRGPSPEKEARGDSEVSSKNLKSSDAVSTSVEAQHPGRKIDSMLSRVEFSHDGDSTPSLLEPCPKVPFQGYTQDGEVSTSDKENEQRPVSRRGPQPSVSVSTTESCSSSYRGDPSQTSLADSVQSSVSASMVSAQSSSQLTDSETSSIQRSVSESQTSFKSCNTARTSDSESSTLRTDNMMSSKDSSCFSGPLPANSASTDIQQFIMNIIGNPVPPTNVSQDLHMQSSANVTEHKEENSESVNQKKLFKKGHMRKGSYTLSEPSPVLLRSHGLTVGDQERGCDTPSDQVLNLPPENTADSASKPIQRKLDYDEVEEQIKPMNIPMPPGPGADAKVDHINRYLCQVQQQNLTGGFSPTISSSETQGQVTSQGHGSEVVDSMSIVQSLIESIESLPDADPESLLKIHASKIEMLRQQMVAQQRHELEELFVQQRREQMLLQQEVEAHQNRLKEQQDFLAANAPETLKKGKSLSRSTGDLEETEVKVRNVPHHASHVSMSHAEDHNSLRQSTPKQSVFSKGASQSPKVYRPVLRSPMKSAPFLRRSGPVHVPNEAYAVHMKPKFDRVSAVAKGFLTRRLMQSEKVQELLLTIKDTRDFALSFSSETPIKRGNFSNQDRDLLERIIAQLQAALLDIHEIFFEISEAERMSLIAHTRQLQEEKRLKSSGGSLRGSHPRISAATLKAMERKRMAQQAEASVFGATTARPRTAPPTTSSPRPHATDHSGPIRRHYHFLLSRALKPLQGQISPIRAEGNSPRNEKDRPKTAPEKSDSLKTRRQSAPAKSGTASTSTVKQSRPQSAKAKVTTKKSDKKSDKAWR